MEFKLKYGKKKIIFIDRITVFIKLFANFNS